MEKLSLYNGPAGALPMHKRAEKIPGVFSHQSWRFVGGTNPHLCWCSTLTLVRVEHNIFVIIYISFIRENDHPNSGWSWLAPSLSAKAQPRLSGFGSCGFRKAARLGSQRLFCSSLCLFLFLCLLRITGFYEGQLAALEPGLFPKARQRDVFVRLQKWKKTNDAFRGMNTDIVYIQIQIYIYIHYMYINLCRLELRKDIYTWIYKC